MKIDISGMHCQACVKRVEKALQTVAGAKVETVEVGSAVVAVDPTQESVVLEAIRKAGYQPQTS